MSSFPLKAGKTRNAARRTNMRFVLQAYRVRIGVQKVNMAPMCEALK